MKNNILFLMDEQLSLYEYQSTYTHGIKGGPLNK